MSWRVLAAATLVLSSGVACSTRTPPSTVVHGLEVSGKARLTVRFVGLESDSGVVAVALFDSADSFKNRSDAVATERIRPRNGEATWTVDPLEPGSYAIAAYHDLNDNGELDAPKIGPPKEPYGFSNDARGAFGPPKFEKAVIRVVPGALTVEISLR